MNFAAYDADREIVIKRALDAGVGMITVGTDLESSKAAVTLAETHEEMWATVGLHPVYAGESNNDFLETGAVTGRRPIQEFNESEFKTLASHPKVVAIGECGLDYFHSRVEDIQNQKEMFYRHISLANLVKKPLMLHVRNAKDGTDAYQEAVSILKERANVRANFHFFAGTLSDLKSILEIGGTVSFTGVVSFTRDYDEIVKKVPMDRIMSETDCPYLAPIPNRGKRNEPAFVLDTINKIAEIRGENPQKLSEQIFKNARNMFGI